MGGSDLRRVEYYLTEGRLERRTWPILDRVQDSNPTTLQLIEDVRGIEINILGYADSEWQSSMPDDSTPKLSVLPRAIEVTITTEKYGAVSRLFVIGS